MRYSESHGITYLTEPQEFLQHVLLFVLDILRTKK